MGYQPRASGGASITDPNVAYIRSDGNDATGNGSPSAPFLTAQKAADSGFTRFNIGVVNAGDIAYNDATTRELFFSGVGLSSIVGNISNTGVGGALSIVDTGFRSVEIISVSTVPSSDGQSGANITVQNVKIGSISAGGSATVGAGSGGSGGAVTAFGACSIGSASSVGGEAPGGTGGAGGSILIVGPSTVDTSISTLGGSGGSPGGDGGVTVKQGGSIPTPTPDAATVAGAVINGVWYDNSYP